MSLHCRTSSTDKSAWACNQDTTSSTRTRNSADSSLTSHTRLDRVLSSLSWIVRESSAWTSLWYCPQICGITVNNCQTIVILFSLPHSDTCRCRDDGEWVREWFVLEPSGSPSKCYLSELLATGSAMYRRDDKICLIGHRFESWNQRWEFHGQRWHSRTPSDRWSDVLS